MIVVVVVVVVAVVILELMFTEAMVVLLDKSLLLWLPHVTFFKILLAT